MKEIILNWMNDPLTSRFTCSSLDDLIDLDAKVQQLIESELRKKIIDLFLDSPTQDTKSIYWYLHNLVYESNQEAFKGVEADYNFKVVLKVVTKMFNFEDLYKQIER